MSSGSSPDEMPARLGYELFGVFLSLWLFGVVSVQTVRFFTNYPNERNWVKAFVGILVLADGVQTLIGMGTMWAILINRGDTDVPPQLKRLFLIFPVFVGFIAGSVQIFFAWRIKVLSTNFALFVPIVVLAVPQFVCGIVYTALFGDGTSEDSSTYTDMVVGWIAFSILCDLVITATLVVTLRKHHANRNIGGAAPLVQRIKIMSIHSSLVTILWSFCLLITLAATKNGAYYMFLYPLGKVYLITMLASLNSRPVVRPELDPRIQSVLQRNSMQRITNRESMDDVEKLARPQSRLSTHSWIPTTPSKAVQYLPVTQEEDESVLVISNDHRIESRPSNEGIIGEVQPLVFPKPETPSPPRTLKSISSRPRGPRLPAVPSSAARSVSL